MSARDPRHDPSPSRGRFAPATEPGRRALRALGAGVLVMAVSIVVLNTAGQGLAATLLGGVSVAFVLASLVLASVALIRGGERALPVFGAWAVAALLLVLLLHSLVISD